MYTHAATRPQGLYIVTLLDEAFGFSRQDRDITLALKVQGLEVEWTLGYALAEVLPQVLPRLSQ